MMRGQISKQLLPALLSAAFVAAAIPVSDAGAGQGTGNPKLTLSVQVAQAARVTDLTVTGVDYLVPPHAPGTDVFGGVYVFFGWVSDPVAFGPSVRNSQNNNGVMGVSFIYPGDGADPGTRDPGTGTMRMVSFTEGGESGNATEFHMDRNGNWTTKLRIYSSVFSAQLPSGEVRTIDCMKLKSGQCGVFTIGAHGKSSSTNEKFVPVRFSGASPSAPPPAASASSGGSNNSPSATTPRAQHTDVAGGGVAGSTADGATTGSAPGSASEAAGASGQSPAGSNADSASPADSDGLARDEVALSDAGRSSGANSTGEPTQTNAIVASVKSVESDGAEAPALVAGVVLIGVVAGATVLFRRRRAKPTS